MPCFGGGHHGGGGVLVSVCPSGLLINQNFKLGHSSSDDHTPQFPKRLLEPS